jgi:hypothetical protein
MSLGAAPELNDFITVLLSIDTDSYNSYDCASASNKIYCDSSCEPRRDTATINFKLQLDPLSTS